jgi:hypothetical protein
MEYFLFFGIYPNKIILFPYSFRRWPKREMFENSSAIATLSSYKKQVKPFLLLLMALCALAVVPVNSQSEPVLPRALMGTWEGEGQLFGEAASFYMEWKQSLEGKFLSLSFRNSFTDGSGTMRAMEARAYYQLDSYKGYWFDSRGQMLPLSFHIEGNTLTVLWGDNTTEQGKTIYSFGAAEAEVKDFVYRKDDYVPFGTAAYQKKE